VIGPVSALVSLGHGATLGQSCLQTARVWTEIISQVNRSSTTSLPLCPIQRTQLKSENIPTDPPGDRVRRGVDSELRDFVPDKLRRATILTGNNRFACVPSLQHNDANGSFRPGTQTASAMCNRRTSSSPLRLPRNRTARAIFNSRIRNWSGPRMPPSPTNTNSADGMPSQDLRHSVNQEVWPFLPYHTSTEQDCGIQRDRIVLPFFCTPIYRPIETLGIYTVVDDCNF
jgi:hypothetical protein